MSEIMKQDNEETRHELKNKWMLYVHLPHDTNWNLDSYKKVYKMESVEEVITLYETMPEVMIKNSMLFLMKDDIKPIWEDEKNKEGGSFSYKISNENVVEVWKKLSYMLMGLTLSKNIDFLYKVNGLSISPKKNFCIIKLWMSDCSYSDTMDLVDIDGLDKTNVLFKKHNPEF